MHSMPSMRGMVRSMVTTSGSVFLNSSMASIPLAAVPTSCRSSNCCERSMRRRSMFESSTIISLKDRLPLMLPMSVACSASADGGADRLGGGRQEDLEAGEAAGVGAHADLAPERVHAARYDVHADPAAGIHGHVLLGGETRTKDQGHGGARVHAAGLLFADQLLAYRGGLERLGCDARAVVLEHQLVAVAVLAEVHAHDADVLLGVRTAHLGRLDAMHGRITQHLDKAVLDDRGIRQRHLAESRHGQPEALGVVLGQPLGHRLQRG